MNCNLRICLVLTMLLLYACSPRPEHGLWISKPIDREQYPMSPDHMTLKFESGSKAVVRMVDVEHKEVYPIYGTYHIAEGVLTIQPKANIETSFDTITMKFTISEDGKVLTTFVKLNGEEERQVFDKHENDIFRSYHIAENSRPKQESD